MSKRAVLGSLCLFFPFFLTSHGAQAAYPDYVLACANLMENLKQSPVHVPSHEGRPATTTEVFASKDLERWLRRNGGQLHRIDSGATVNEARIFRWTSPTGDGRIVKAYSSKYEALQSDRQFRFLDHNLPVGIVEIIPRTGKYRSLRFYKDVHGVTIAHLIREKYYPDEVNAEIRRLYIEHLDAFKSRIIERYGERNVREIKDGWNMIVPDLHLEIVTSPGRTIGIWIHDENVLFDSKTKEFFIIDPE